MTDAKLKTLVPLMVRFRTVKIGGKQDYGVKGIQDLRIYMEELKVSPCTRIYMEELKERSFSHNIQDLRIYME